MSWSVTQKLANGRAGYAETLFGKAAGGWDGGRNFVEPSPGGEGGLMRCVNDEALPLWFCIRLGRLPKRFAYRAVMMGTRMAVTITLAATSAVAEAATGSKAGLIWAMITGFATAAPAAEEAATPAVPFPPPITRSAMISGMPVIMITATPVTIPSRPVSRITFRLMVFPSAKPKNGSAPAWLC